jgi:hypothetical protein
VEGLWKGWVNFTRVRLGENIKVWILRRRISKFLRYKLLMFFTEKLTGLSEVPIMNKWFAWIVKSCKW